MSKVTPVCEMKNSIAIRNKSRLARAFDRSITSVVDCVIFSWLPFVLLWMIDGKMAANLIFENPASIQAISGRCAVLYFFCLLAITPLPLIYLRFFFRFVQHAASPGEALVGSRMIGTDATPSWLFELKLAPSQYFTLVIATAIAVGVSAYLVSLSGGGPPEVLVGLPIYTAVCAVIFFLALLILNMPLYKNDSRSFLDHVTTFNLKVAPLGHAIPARLENVDSCHLQHSADQIWKKSE